MVLQYNEYCNYDMAQEALLERPSANIMLPVTPVERSVFLEQPKTVLYSTTKGIQ